MAELRIKYHIFDGAMYDTNDGYVVYLYEGSADSGREKVFSDPGSVSGCDSGTFGGF